MVKSGLKKFISLSHATSLIFVGFNTGSARASEPSLNKATLNEITSVYDSLPDNLKSDKSSLLSENIMVYDESGKIVNEIHSDGRVYSIQWENDRIAAVTDTSGYDGLSSQVRQFL